MIDRSHLNALAIGLVTFFVTQSQAQQPTSKASEALTQQLNSRGSPTLSHKHVSNVSPRQQISKEAPTSTADKVEIDLLKAAKFLPKILDNKKIDFTKPSFSPPGEFLTNKVFGPGSGGGGNLCAMGIVKLTNDVLREGLSRALLTPPQEKSLLDAMKTATFVQGNNLPEIRGEKKNAINFPEEKLIVVDQKACELLIDGGTPGLSLLVHEYMGLAGIDDRDYRASLSFVGELYRQAPAHDGNRPIFNKIIRKVVICAAECQSEILGHRGHDAAYVGVIYYAAATEDTMGRTAICMNEAKQAFVISDRRSDLSSKSCLAALAGKYRGKVVDLHTDTPDDPQNPEEGGHGFRIIPSTKK